MLKLFLAGAGAGAVIGAAFGVAFGLGASLFQGGPEPLVGVRQSWWWFAIVGALIGVGVARAVALDARRRQPPAPPGFGGDSGPGPEPPELPVAPTAPTQQSASAPVA